MIYIIFILLFIIIGFIIYYIINCKRIQQHIEESYLKENREKLNKQLQTEKQFVEDELLLASKRLEEENERFDATLKKHLDDISWLEKKRENAEVSYRQKVEQQEQLIQADKEKQLLAVEEVVNERKARVDVEVDAFREIEMQKARTAVISDTEANQKWAEATLRTYWDGLALSTQEKEQELAEVLALLDDYKKKQQVVNEAILRQRAIDEQQDFFRVCLTQETIEDVQILQNVRQKLHFSESLNKLIYDVYVSKSVQEMVKRILQGGAPSGIYKITRIKTGEVYIGKSTNVKDRWVQHCKTVYGAGTIAHSILHTTIAKDGLENFTFELVEEVSKDKLTEREKYWINFYGSKQYGLNERNG